MVRFGERLELLKQAGWEKYYIDYERLKKMIDEIEAAATAAGANTARKSEAFAESLKKEMEKVDGARLSNLKPRTALCVCMCHRNPQVVSIRLSHRPLNCYARSLCFCGGQQDPR